jgi:anaerobic carbon-monoxide dehydrogenase iron sulfur subunit
MSVMAAAAGRRALWQRPARGTVRSPAARRPERRAADTGYAPGSLSGYAPAIIGCTVLREDLAPLRRRHMQKSLHINPDKCTGCLQCEMACSFENYGTFNTAKSRIKVFDFHHTGRKVPYTCTQCDEAWCLHACPVEAIKIDAATGAKIVLEDVCVGCKVCTIACPFGTVNYVADTGKVQKCDLCGGEPACADACPTGAITYIDASWTGLDRMKQWADKLGNQPSAA